MSRGKVPQEHYMLNGKRFIDVEEEDELRVYMIPNLAHEKHITKRQLYIY